MARIHILPPNMPGNNLVQNSPPAGVEDLSLLATYGFRGKIILDRTTRGFEQAQIDGGREAYETSGLPIFETEKLAREKQMRENRTGREQGFSSHSENYTDEQPGSYKNSNPNPEGKDTITLVDFDYDDSSRRFLRGYKTLTLPFVPREISVQPSSKFVGIATMGRNNPHYHFTGAEDSIEFEIDWFSSQDDRKDVINSCRWVEALTKADAYYEMPHRVKLIWGQDDLLFRDHVWIITAAPYRLTEFQDRFKKIGSDQIIKVGMLPQQATQTVTMKRVTLGNLTSQEILNRL